MKMITLFLPLKYLELLDGLVASGMYPNRSEALRMATWKFLQDNVSLLKVAFNPGGEKSTGKDEKQETTGNGTTAEQTADAILQHMQDIQVDEKMSELMEITPEA